MRLICPNCGAQYEVDDSVIPENGRDVQCSNCGHTWYQRAADSDDEEAEPEVSVTAEPADEPDDIDEEPDQPAPSEPDIATETEPDPESPATELKPRELDNDVTGILQQEAERETLERERDNISLETQPDLGLSETSEDTDANIQKKMDRLRGLDDDHGAATAAAAIGRGPRKDLLPDIEELNSTLTASTESADDESDEVSHELRQRSGFRRAFAVTILIFTVMVLIYAFAPQIAEKFPQLKPALAGYVDLVNALRLWVDTMMQNVVNKLTAIVAQISGDEAG